MCSHCTTAGEQDPSTEAHSVGLAPAGEGTFSPTDVVEGELLPGF